MFARTLVKILRTNQINKNEAMDNLLQGNWYANIADFKRNPQDFFAKHGVNDDSLTVDILQV